ncbi:hypothetical protein [Hydrocoleum sp. CS-953]|nr:hypothetical protein [Hydrocoleum sp. CS-953]
MSIEVLIKGGISGKIMGFLTDIVPTLAARPEKADLIFQAKGRSQDKPLI